MARFDGPLLGTLFIILSILCTGTSTVLAKEPTGEPTNVIYFQRLAVAPFLVGQRQPSVDESLDDTLTCPINEICVADPTIQFNAGPKLMHMVHAALKARFEQRVIPLDEVQTAYAGIRLDGTKDTPRTMAIRMGVSLSADLLIMGTVWRYQDRGAFEGFPDKPASVAFALYLVDPKSGRQLWRGVFDEAQEIVLQDMARFAKRIKMGLTWLSADELARHGVKEVLRPFPPSIKTKPLEDTESKETK